MKIPRLVIAGTHSGVGKTTITLAIMAALSRRGLTVQPFKVGPDYLDPFQHKAATGRGSRNLDAWMMPREYAIQTFTRSAAGADIALIEGMMGVFDGKETSSEEGSTAQMAKWLSAPVILVVDAGGMARSLGALLQGFSRFDPELTLAGALFNRAGGEGHLRWLQEVARSDLRSFGGLTESEEIEIPERHLGLVPPRLADSFDGILDRLAELAEKYCDIEGLLQLAATAPSLETDIKDGIPKSKRCRIAIGWDEAFHFYYADNLDQLEQEGAELVFFSPVHDDALPEAIHGLYLGGGYPEVYAKELAVNSPMRAAIRRFAEAGGSIYAECGGMIYLARQLKLVSGERIDMAGVIPGVIEMKKGLTAIGYVEVEAWEDNPILKLGEKARGHLFHYSDWEEVPPEEGELKRVYHVRKGGEEKMEGYLYRNVLASYIHLHFGSNPRMASTFVEQCTSWSRLH